MKHENRSQLYLSIVMIGIFAVIFVYILTKAIVTVKKERIGTKDGIYVNRVTTNKEINDMAKMLSKGCKSDLCKVQNILDYVTNIPYKINHFKAHSPQKTIQNNFGDCDDKSNLLISMLHSIGIESYFVLVPEHIFVIARIDDKRLEKIPGLWIDNKKYYILESTAKNSPVGFPLGYPLSQIDTIIDPFSNEKVEYEKLGYR